MAPLVVRRLMADDVPALTAEVERARAAGEFRASSDADAEFFGRAIAQNPDLASGAFDDGALVGFVSGEFKVVVVRPDRRRRGIGRALIDGATDSERRRGRPAVIMGVLPDDDGGRAFLEAIGFGFHSTLWDLDLARDHAVAEPAWPVGFAVRTFDRTRDAVPWVDLFNAAFADHATPLQLDLPSVVAGFDDPAIVDDDVLLVEDGATGDLVAFCATSPIRRDGAVEPHGEIWTVGVRPDRQGGGLGRQLLRWGVRRLRSIGAIDVSLSVNGRNERALGLYESEGFVRTRTRERWSRPVTAAGDDE